MNPILASILSGLWLGEQASLDAFVELLKSEHVTQMMLSARPAIMASASGSADDPYPDNSVKYVKDGNTAVLSIAGPLVNSNSWVLGYIGATGYPHIVERLQQALNDPEVTNIVADFNTPGGSTNGILAASDAMESANKIKPVNALVENAALSAGYWLANAASSITIGKLGMVGSIGTIMTHTDYSKMHEKNGITRTVLRVGDNKALASPDEPLTDKAKSQLLEMMNHFNNGFLDQVAKGRGTTRAEAEQRWGGGDLFYGNAAVRNGAADMLGTYSDVVANSKKMAENRGVSTNLRLSAEGMNMTIEELMAQVTTLTDAKAAAEAELATVKADVSAQIDAAVTTAKKDGETALIDAKVEIQGLKTKLDEATGQVEALSGIARDSLANMNVALGQPKADLSGLSGATLIARHTEVAATFAAKFPGGQVSASSASAEDEPTQKAPSAGELAMHQARMAAVVGR